MGKKLRKNMERRKEERGEGGRMEERERKGKEREETGKKLRENIKGRT